jgi:hypothetical protein
MYSVCYLEHISHADTKMRGKKIMKTEYFMRIGIPETTVEDVKETLAKVESLLGVEAIKEDKHAVSIDAGMMSGYMPLFPYRGHIPEVGDFACFTFDVKSLVEGTDWKKKREELGDLLKAAVSEEIRVPGIYKVTGTDLRHDFELVRDGRAPFSDGTLGKIVDETLHFYAGAHGEKVLTSLYSGAA